MIPGMDKSSNKTTPAVKPTLAKIEGSQARKNDFNHISVIGSLNFLTNSTRPEAQFAVHQCAWFSADPRLPNDQAVKRVLKYPKGTNTQGLILKLDPEKGIECYMYADFEGVWNKEEGKYPGPVLSITGYVITNVNCQIIWVRRIQT